ncbi:alpha/beta hydrolase [Mycobacterium sp. Y57]|uniref:alpha/beta hydrolase n=1 Tax=Mycolicibacterium xanthum TaxID=2796469 RepID=UPI001C859FF2|nr:alpha/beta hydrolase [Mycolicibacterium xanthum]MBX7432626.1 alpha/beta hydrolase [Mycolicibacterium xanthum]
MSAIDAFYAAWTNARRTFGAGAPQGGARFDAGARLGDLGADVAAAAPGPLWSGRAASAYAARNTTHRAVFDGLATLDQRLGRSVDRSAAIVTAGRRDLEALRRWVTDAADGVPPGAQQQAQLTRIAGTGLARLTGIVHGAGSDLHGVAQDITGIKTGYDALGFTGEPPAAPIPDVPAAGGDTTDMSSGDIDAIDRANRRLLAEMFDEYQQLPDGQVKTDRLADIAAIREALKVPDSHLVYLEEPADPSQMIPAATSVGDPFTADHVSVTVPGVSGTTRGTIAGMTGEAAELRNEAIDVATAAGSPEHPISTSIATMAWVGYQPPANLGQMSVLSDDLAQAGAPKLTSFLGDLDAASRNPGQTTALFGHSYGSLTSGIALGDGASRYVDNAVLYGSPGFQATTPADLGMTDDDFFVMSAFDDPINSIGAVAPYHGWGSDPNDIIDEDGHLRFRFQHLETSAGDTPIAGYESKTGASGHPDYGRNAGERMTGYNLAAILLDRPDLAVTETPYSWR